MQVANFARSRGFSMSFRMSEPNLEPKLIVSTKKVSLRRTLAFFFQWNSLTHLFPLRRATLLSHPLRKPKKFSKVQALFRDTRGDAGRVTDARDRQLAASSLSDVSRTLPSPRSRVSESRVSESRVTSASRVSQVAHARVLGLLLGRIPASRHRRLEKEAASCLRGSQTCRRTTCVFIVLVRVCVWLCLCVSVCVCVFMCVGRWGGWRNVCVWMGV